MRTMLRALSALVITGSLVLGTSAASGAQEPGDRPTGFADLCEVDVLDGGTVAACLETVATCLEPTDGTTGSTDPTLATDLLRCTTDTLGDGARYIARVADISGRWIALDDEGDRPAAGSRKWRAVAASTAEDLGAYLLSVTPGPCNEGILLDAWTLFGAFELAAGGAASGGRLVDDALTGLLMGSMGNVPPGCRL